MAVTEGVATCGGATAEGVMEVEDTVGGACTDMGEVDTVRLNSIQY